MQPHFPVARPRSQPHRRPVNPRDDPDRSADEVFHELLAALRQGALDQANHRLHRLVSAGYCVEPIPGTDTLRLALPREREGVRR
jgi:hypothetical protein